MSERNQIPEWSGGKLENGEFLNYSKEVSRIAHGFDAAEGAANTSPTSDTSRASTTSSTRTRRRGSGRRS